eukprot:Opistho-2@52632
MTVSWRPFSTSLKFRKCSVRQQLTLRQSRVWMILIARRGNPIAHKVRRDNFWVIRTTLDIGMTTDYPYDYPSDSMDSCGTRATSTATVSDSAHRSRRQTVHCNDTRLRT